MVGARVALLAVDRFRGGDPRLGAESIGTIAVAAFFSISGYLITASRLKLSVMRFAWHRFLRIFPGYWVMLLVVALVLAPGVAFLAGERWTFSAAVEFVGRGWSTRYGAYELSGTLLSAPFGTAWNGSSWTLWYELLCYVAAAAALSLTALRSWRWALVATGVASVCNLLLHDGPSEPVLFLHLVVFFSAGATLCFAADVVPLRPDLFAVAAASAVAACLVGALDSLGALPLSYVALYLGARLPVHLQTDISYGVYIYAFPVQQSLVDLDLVRGPWAMALLASVVVVPVALLSWSCVERPALRMKHWQPGIRPRRISEPSGR